MPETNKTATEPLPKPRPDQDVPARVAMREGRRKDNRRRVEPPIHRRIFYQNFKRRLVALAIRESSG